MERTLRVKRLYWLGDYKNIEFGEEITQIPADIAFNPEVIDRIRYLQLLTTEISFQRYISLVKQTAGLASEDVIAALEKSKLQTFDELKQVLNGHLKTTGEE